MANLTILEALQLSLNATKKYVDDKVPHYNEILITEISGDNYRFFRNNNYFNMSALNIDETKSYVGKDINITDNEEYTFKFVYDKEADALLGESFVYIYNHKSYNGENFVEDVNSAVLTFDITPMVLGFEGEGYFRLYKVEKLELDNKCLPDNVSIPNSLTVGTRIGDIGELSVAEGNVNTASGNASHAEGSYTIASGNISHAEGGYTTASGDFSHAECDGATASGIASHAEGKGTEASGYISHAEGMTTTASGSASHAEGRNTIASGMGSHAEGDDTKATSDFQHVQGKYNINDTANKYAHIVGNGVSNGARSNAHTLDWSGNGWYAGKLSQDGVPTEDKDLTTKKYVDEKVAEANASGGYTHPDSHPASMITGLATVATSGSYNDLTNKPTIPIKTSELTNDSGFTTKEYVDNYPSDIKVITTEATSVHVFMQEFKNSSMPIPGIYYLRPTNSISYNIDGSTISVYGIFQAYYKDDNLHFAFYDINVQFFLTTDNDLYASTIFVRKGHVLTKTNTVAYTPTSDYHPATKLYVDEKVADIVDSAPEALNTLNELATALGNDANFATTISNQIGLKANSADLATVATSGSYNDLSDKPTIPAAYTHPASHPASMITGLHTVATSGDYNDLTNKPITILTAAENEFIILSELAVGAYLITGLVKYMSTDTAPQPFNNSFVEVLKNGSTTYVADPFNVSVIDSNYNSIEVAPRVNMQADWNTVDETDPTYINNKPTIPTVTNDLTNELKTNYDAAYEHSTSAHAPSNAQKNSDITKAEIEAKLTGNITTHTHSQYLTSIPSEYITEQELTSKGYATESQINSAIEAAATTHEEVKTTVNQILGGAYIE